jgi:hypothetical protein
MLPFLFLLATAGDDLAKSIQEATSTEKYIFEVETRNSKVDGRFRQGSPLFVRADGIEFFRQEKRLVYLQDGKWNRTRTGTLSDPLRILGATAKVQSLVIPHEELARLSKSLRNLKKFTEQGAVLVSGEFGEAEARELARSEDRDVARGGVARVWIDNGKVAKYQIAITLKGRRGNADVDGVAETTVTIRHPENASYAVPDEARKALKD